MREDARTKAALRRLVGHPTLSIKTLAADLGMPVTTLHHWCDPTYAVPTLSQVRALVWAAAKQDQQAARELAAALYGLDDAGWILAAAPQPAPDANDVVKEVMEVGAATGQLQGWAVQARADGVVTPSEAVQGIKHGRTALREMAEAIESLERVVRPRLPLSAQVMA